MVTLTEVPPDGAGAGSDRQIQPMEHEQQGGSGGGNERDVGRVRKHFWEARSSISVIPCRLSGDFGRTDRPGERTVPAVGSRKSVRHRQELISERHGDLLYHVLLSKTGPAPDPGGGRDSHRAKR